MLPTQDSEFIAAYLLGKVGTLDTCSMKMTSDSGESLIIKYENKTMNYQEIDWKTCHEKLTVLQARLVEAHRAKEEA